MTTPRQNPEDCPTPLDRLRLACERAYDSTAFTLPVSHYLQERKLHRDLLPPIPPSVVSPPFPASTGTREDDDTAEQIEQYAQFVALLITQTRPKGR